MRNLVMLVALVGVLAGCTRTAIVKFDIDSEGKVVNTRLVQSAGSAQKDKIAIDIATKVFARRVPRPFPRTAYTQPVGFNPGPKPKSGNCACTQ